MTVFHEQVSTDEIRQTRTVFNVIVQEHRAARGDFDFSVAINEVRSEVAAESYSARRAGQRARAESTNSCPQVPIYPISN